MLGNQIYKPTKSQCLSCATRQNITQRLRELQDPSSLCWQTGKPQGIPVDKRLAATFWPSHRLAHIYPISICIQPIFYLVGTYNIPFFWLFFGGPRRSGYFFL